MDAVLTWIGIALAALVVVAVTVAAWETCRSLTSHSRGTSEQAPAAHAALAAGIDVDVDALARTPAAAHGDSADRRATLERALGKLAQTPAATPAETMPPAAIQAPASRPISWVDTEPMVGPGLRAEPRRTSAKAPSA